MHVPYKDIADTLGFNERQIRGWINNHCVNKNRVFADSYFDNIDTPTKAYLLGLIYADGWISTHKRKETATYSYEFGIQLQREDRYLLDVLNSELGGVHKINDIETDYIIANNKAPSHCLSSVLRVYSKRLVLSLMNHHITTDKTYSALFPEVDDGLFAYFIKGYFDGDGCVSANNRGTPVVHFTAFGSKFLLYVQKKLDDLYGIKSSIYAENDRKHRLMIFRNADVCRFYDVIYANDCEVCLRRKYQKYSTLLGLSA